MTTFELWLGWLDSNQRMPIPKTGALPLGDTPRKKTAFKSLLQQPRINKAGKRYSFRDLYLC